ncbi:hypothetical protein ACEUZ9_001075 [Paracoccus litorisediminis]|uniref:hypothetical protein n=1 Tax=Paracoccus litorisediminis TaxID=2006130 RepID=UPI00373288E6
MSILSPDGTSYKLTPELQDRRGQRADPSWERIEAELASLSANFEPLLAQGWRHSPFITGAVTRPDPEPAGQDGEAYHARLDALVAALEAAGVTGARKVCSVHPGWVSVMERAVSGMIYRLALEPGANLAVQQVKEKFGTLRFYVSPTGSDQLRSDIFDIATWAEVATDGRCAVTGEPGGIAMDGWLLTLNHEMEILRRHDRAAFDKLLHPAGREANT